MAIDRFNWTKLRMPFVYLLGDQLSPSRNSVLINLPLTWETLCLVDAIRKKFKQIIVTPLTSGEHSSLQPSVFHYLDDWNITYFTEATPRNRKKALNLEPNIILDCIFTVSGLGLREGILPPTALLIEDTRTGGVKLRHQRAKRHFPNPFFILDESHFKYQYENRLGIGYSVIASLMFVGLFLPGREIAVVGFGPVGQGVADFAKRVGARVSVVEIDENRRNQAHHQGYSIVSLEAAITSANIVVTATGRKKVIKQHHLDKLNDCTFLVNVGADFGEWDQKYLRATAMQIRMSDFLQQFTMPDGKRIIEIAGGNSVNLVCGISTSDFIDVTFALAIAVMKQQQEKPVVTGEVVLDNSISRYFETIISKKFEL